ncbi:PilZ domain-containing protein [Peribacillus sp. SCS-26]|uniref:PilZ domain-containing protein n=1 Tax=Paraperibacillus marinus TaxID=3115295 RepID=UPI0039062584
MQYKREEPFRFSLQTPVPGTFTISRNSSKKGKLDIVDISPNGLKFQTDLDLPDKDLELTVSFQLNESMLVMHGTTVWKKRHFGKYLYGFAAAGTPETRDGIKQQIIKELKIFIKK